MITFEISDSEASKFFDECVSKFSPVTDDPSIIEIMKEKKNGLHQIGVVNVRRGNGRIYKSYKISHKISQHELESCKREVAFFEEQQSYEKTTDKPITAICRIDGVYCDKDTGTIHIKMEDCEGEMDVSKPMSATDVKTKFKQSLDGVEFMHNKLKFGHYDLKPRNIGDSGKLFDFGECATTAVPCKLCPLGNLTRCVRTCKERQVKAATCKKRKILKLLAKATQNAETDLADAKNAAAKEESQCSGCNGTGLKQVTCGHINVTEEYTPDAYTTRPQERTKTADLFAMGVTLLEMLCGKIESPTDKRIGKQAFGWELVEADGAWKARWTSGFLNKNGDLAKCFTCQGYGTGCLKCGKSARSGSEPPYISQETRLPGIPACPQAKPLVRSLLVDFETIQWDDVGDRKGINTLYDAFKSCTCSNYCNKPAKPTPGRRLIERFIRASEYCISS